LHVAGATCKAGQKDPQKKMNTKKTAAPKSAPKSEPTAKEIELERARNQKRLLESFLAATRVCVKADVTAGQAGALLFAALYAIKTAEDALKSIKSSMVNVGLDPTLFNRSRNLLPFACTLDLTACGEIKWPSNGHCRKVLAMAGKTPLEALHSWTADVAQARKKAGKTIVLEDSTASPTAAQVDKALADFELPKSKKKPPSKGDGEGKPLTAFERVSACLACLKIEKAQLAPAEIEKLIGLIRSLNTK